VYLLAAYIIREHLCSPQSLGYHSLAILLDFIPLMASSPPKRTLPSKESSLFRELLNLYETRQLKKGQKIADQILKKFPEHGGPYNLPVDKSV
jgi:hypothetical protein